MYCLMYKCVNRITPGIVHDRFILVDDVSKRITRNTDEKMLRLPKCKTEFYRKSFIYSGSEIWNDLPLEAQSQKKISHDKVFFCIVDFYHVT